METAEGLARSSDPATSHEAATVLVALGEHSRMCQVALSVLRQWPGSTALELDHYGGFSDGGVRKRLNDLRKRGMAHTRGTRRCRFSGRNAQVWWPTTQQVQMPLF